MKFGQILKNAIKQNGGKSGHYLKDDMLMRDYVAYKLYSEAEGYYSGSNKEPIGRLDQPLNFKTMKGISDYVKELNSKYPKSTWLTCSELLRPYFGYAIGSNILTQHKKNEEKGNIKIIEIGTGAGGAIDGILEYFQNFNMKFYRDIEYVGFEPSVNLADVSREILSKKHSELFNNGQINILSNNFENLDIDYNDTVYILAFNLVNSLPHDKVIIPKGAGENIFNKFKENYNLPKDRIGLRPYQIFDEFREFFNSNIDTRIQETHVVSDKAGKLTQIYKPLTDSLIKDIVSYQIIPDQEKAEILGRDFVEIESNSYRRHEDTVFNMLKNIQMSIIHGDNVWLPTGVLTLYDKIINSFPKHKLILLDFDFLPNNVYRKDYKGKNAPAVYSIKENTFETLTHKSIFASINTEKRPVNIYFEVDFNLLRFIYMIKAKRTANIMKFPQFMNDNALSEWCDSLSGFNPLTDSHKNLSFLLSN
jgi:hypothetical protein